MEELVKACKEGRLSDVERLLEDPDQDRVKAAHGPLERDENGWSPLHYASKYGHQRVVKHLLDKGFDPSITTPDNSTPLHLACAYNRAEVAETLLSRSQTLPGWKAVCLRRKDGNTPLHLAISNGVPNLTLVKHLLSVERPRESNSDYNIRNEHARGRGATPFSLALDAISAGRDRDAYIDIASALLNHAAVSVEPFLDDLVNSKELKGRIHPYEFRLSLDRPVKVFVVGDRESGKSSLIASMQSEGFLSNLRGYALLNVQRVVNHKIGLLSADFVSRSMHRRIIFYDLASCRDFAHEHPILSEKDLEVSLFIICVDLRAKRHKIRASIQYWMSFVYNQCFQMDEQHRPRVVIVGSFAERLMPLSLAPQQRLHLDYCSITSNELFSGTRYRLLRKYSLDCRKEASPALSKLCNALKNDFGTMPPSTKAVTKPCSYILNAILTDIPGVAITIGDLVSIISSGRKRHNLMALLPLMVEEILELCKSLEEAEHLIVLEPVEACQPENTVIVHRQDDLLTQINSALAALDENSKPRPLQNILGSTSPAVMTYEDMKNCLSKIDSPLDFDMLLQVIEYFRISEVIPADETSLNKQLFYIPFFLRQKHDVQPWDRNTTKTKSFAWVIAPSETLESFMPRFLKMLLLQLLVFADTEFTSQSYMMWSEGICISNPQDTLDICVIVNEKFVALNMRYQPSCEIECLSYRNCILGQIGETKERYQQSIATIERILTSNQKRKFPIRQQLTGKDQVIDVANLKKQLMSDSGAIDHPPFFEPYVKLSKLPELYRQGLTSPANTTPLTHKMIMDEVEKQFGEDKWTSLLQHFQFTNPSKRGDIVHCQADSPETVHQEFEGAFIATTDAKSSNPGTQQTGRESETIVNFAYLMRCLSSISIFGPDPEKFKRALRTNSPEESNSDDDYGRRPSVSTSTQSHSVLLDPIFEQSDTSDSVSNSPSNVTSSETPSQPATMSGSLSSFSNPKATNLDPISQGSKRKDTLPFSRDDSFIGGIGRISCKVSGDFPHPPHGVVVSIPEGATDTTTDILVAITLQGPMSFEEPNIRPLSPVVMLSLQNGAPLKEAVKLTIPHCFQYTDEDGDLLTFFRAKTSGKVGERLHFRQVAGCMGRTNGTVEVELLTSSPYYFCIGCKKTPYSIAKTDYCIIKIMPRSTTSNKWSFFVCVSYLLPTCIEMVQSKFEWAEQHYIEDRIEPFAFQTAEDEEAVMSMSFEHFHDSSKWHFASEGIKEITSLDVDYAESQVQRQIHWSCYPPRFTVNVNGERANKNYVAQFNFTGIVNPRALRMEIPLVPLSAPSAASSSVSNLTLLSGCTSTSHGLNSPNGPGEPEHKLYRSFSKTRSLSSLSLRGRLPRKPSDSALSEPGTYSCGGSYQDQPHTPAQSNTPKSASRRSSKASLSGERPDLRELLSFRTDVGQLINIPRKIGTNFRNFGIHLLEDDGGQHIEALAMAHNYKQFENINLAILSEWIDGKGVRPVSWQTLVEVLNTAQLNTLAEDIRKVKLSTDRCSYFELDL